MQVTNKNTKDHHIPVELVTDKVGQSSSSRLLTFIALVVTVFMLHRFFDLQKTLRKFNSWLMWLSKLIGKGEDGDPATKAHTGVENQMYYDKARGRWVERGKEHEADAAMVVAPPPLAFAKKSDTTTANSTGRSLYTDPLAEMGFVKAEARPTRPQFIMPTCNSFLSNPFIFSWS